MQNAEDLDTVMSMYNLIEYSKNYTKTIGSLWNYYRDVPNNRPLNPSVGNNPPTVDCNADPITNSASFKYQSKITEISIGDNFDQKITIEEGEQIDNSVYDSQKMLQLLCH